MKTVRAQSLWSYAVIAATLWLGYACGQLEPGVEVSRCRLILPRVMAAAIERVAPAFRPWDASHLAPEVRLHYKCTPRQAPYAVVGDFNGDGRTDLTVEGRDQRGRVHLTLLSSGKRWRIVEVSRWSLTAADSLGWHYFAHVAPGEIRAPEEIEPQPLRLTTEAFEVVFWEQGSAVYFWRDGTFKQYVTGD